MHPLADTGRVIARRYRLEAPIGRGAMGVVWRAHDQLLDREVAIKEVQIADTLTESERANAFQRTLREAKTAARLNHPAVVTVYDVAEDGGRPWIVMQLVHAQSLDQVLAASGPLSPRRAAEVGWQLLSALDVAHAAGVMHRDVKPSNVLLGGDDRAVLTDFGIATFQGDPRLTQTGMVMGSPGFTAPERIRGEDASPASDLWSLGATLYAAVEGHGPYERRGGAITTMSAIINEDAPAAPTAGALGPVIAALLRREPAERPDARTAIRMIGDVLPLLPDSAQTAGYHATALSTSLDAVAAAGQLVEHDAAQGPPAAAGAPAAAAAAGASASVEPTAPTKPQPTFGDATRYPEGPPPDFSSWYSPSARSGSAPPASGSGPGSGSGSGAGAGQPWSGSAPWSGHEYQPQPGPAEWAGTRQGYPAPRRRSGLWWKIALVVLAVLGAGAGAATAMLLHSHRSGGSQGGSTSTTGTLPPTELVHAINQPLTGAPPAGYRSYSQPPSGAAKAGFSMAVPTTWSVTRKNAFRTYFAHPDTNLDMHMLVDLTPHTYPDMLQEAQYIQRRSISAFPGYHREDLARLTIRGVPGAFWKFTWLDNGVPQTTLDLLFTENTPSGQQSYALLATAPTKLWLQLRPVFDEELRSFATSQG
jgi:serine/threonine protein kinase